MTGVCNRSNVHAQCNNMFVLGHENDRLDDVDREAKFRRPLNFQFNIYFRVMLFGVLGHHGNPTR